MQARQTVRVRPGGGAALVNGLLSSQYAVASSRCSKGDCGVRIVTRPARWQSSGAVSVERRSSLRRYASECSPPSGMCSTRSESGCGYAIMRKTSLRGAWWRDLWATLAGSPHRVATEVDLKAMNWVGVAPDEGLIACFEQHPAPLVRAEPGG